MECYRRAMLGEQTLKPGQPKPSEQTLPHLCAVARRPQSPSCKGQQKVTVEHVHVHSGGQAIVGMKVPSPLPDATRPTAEKSDLLEEMRAGPLPAVNHSQRGDSLLGPNR